VGYPNGMERQAIAIRFSLPVASANSLHSLFKACAATAHNTKHYEIIITYANHYIRNYYIRVLGMVKVVIGTMSLLINYLNY